ncbi:MAG: nucleoside triphosphate pyrophosphohydrolase [Alphaproteobacteria bacterium]|nr:nucleoside triphosphate pyrophosphohydrolase [Alphaproteobacteria bacterium]
MYKKFKTGILVRDKMIARMRRDKIRVDYKQLNQEDYIASLRNKIIEEANEVAEEKDINKLVYELADIFEVIQALSSVVGIKKAEIINAQKEKRVLLK